MQALYIYYQILNIKVNLTIAGTGTISATGQVGPIGGVAQKVFTVNNKVEIFFCPTEHFLEATKAFDKITNPSFKLVFVNNLDEAVKYLSNYE